MRHSGYKAGPHLGSSQNRSMFTGSQGHQVDSTYKSHIGPSPLLSQPYSQRSGAGTHLGNNGCSLVPSMLSQPSQPGIMSQSQGGYSNRPLSSGACPTPNRPTLSGAFRPGSAPLRPTFSQPQGLFATQMSQPQVTSADTSHMLPANTNNHLPANGGVLRPKSVSLLRTSSSMQLQNRPGSAPGLLSVQGHTMASQQPPLSGLQLPSRQQQQHHSLAGTIAFVHGCGSGQQQGCLDPTQGSQGLGLSDVDTFGLGTQSGAALMGSQVPSSVGSRDGSRLRGLLQGLEDGRQKHSDTTLAQQQAANAGIASQIHQHLAVNPSAQGATDPHGTCATPNGPGLEVSGAAAGQVAAGSSMHAATLAEAATPAVAAAAPPGTFLDPELVNRISSLEKYCSCMKTIVDREIPVLLQQQANTNDKLQGLADSTSSNHSSLDAKLQQLAASVASFMDGFKTWQQVQAQHDADRSIIVLSNASCQTSPHIGLAVQPTVYTALAAGATVSIGLPGAAGSGAMSAGLVTQVGLQQAVISPAKNRYCRADEERDYAVAAAAAGGHDRITGSAAGDADTNEPFAAHYRNSNVIGASAYDAAQLAFGHSCAAADTVALPSHVGKGASVAATMDPVDHVAAAADSGVAAAKSGEKRKQIGQQLVQTKLRFSRRIAARGSTAMQPVAAAEEANEQDAVAGDSVLQGLATAADNTILVAATAERANSRGIANVPAASLTEAADPLPRCQRCKDTSRGGQQQQPEQETDTGKRNGAGRGRGRRRGTGKAAGNDTRASQRKGKTPARAAAARGDNGAPAGRGESRGRGSGGRAAAAAGAAAGVSASQQEGLRVRSEPVKPVAAAAVPAGYVRPQQVSTHNNGFAAVAAAGGGGTATLAGAGQGAFVLQDVTNTGSSLKEINGSKYCASTFVDGRGMAAGVGAQQQAGQGLPPHVQKCSVAAAACSGSPMLDNAAAVTASTASQSGMSRRPAAGLAGRLGLTIAINNSSTAGPGVFLAPANPAARISASIADFAVIQTPVACSLAADSMVSGSMKTYSKPAATARTGHAAAAGAGAGAGNSTNSAMLLFGDMDDSLDAVEDSVEPSPGVNKGNSSPWLGGFAAGGLGDSGSDRLGSSGHNIGGGGGDKLVVDDDEIARQVAAHMARHRNKRRRVGSSISKLE